MIKDNSSTSEIIWACKTCGKRYKVPDAEGAWKPKEGCFLCQTCKTPLVLISATPVEIITKGAK